MDEKKMDDWADINERYNLFKYDDGTFAIVDTEKDVEVITFTPNELDCLVLAINQFLPVAYAFDRVRNAGE